MDLSYFSRVIAKLIRYELRQIEPRRNFSIFLIWFSRRYFNEFLEFRTDLRRFVDRCVIICK